MNSGDMGRGFKTDALADIGSFNVRWAGALAALIIAIAAVILMFGQVRLPTMPQFVSIHISFVVVLDVLTTFVLFCQFHFRKQPLYAILAGGYLFNVLTSVLFVLSFPGALLSSGSILGGPQSAPWLWHYWHIGFPLIVAVALVTHKITRGAPFLEAQKWPVTWACLCAVVVIVGLLGVSATVWHDRLPVLLDFGRAPPLTHAFFVVGWTAALATLISIALCKQGGGSRSSLHLWLSVAMVAYLAEVATSLGAYDRYTVGWYFGRIESVIAASVLLIVFLHSLYQLQRRLADSLSEETVSRRAAEEHARKLSSAVENSQQMVCIIGVDGKIEYLNDRFCSARNVLRRDAIGMPIDDAVPEYRPRISEAGPINLSSLGRAGWKGEIETTTPSGETLWTLTSISPYADETGRVTHFVIIEEDITARKQTENDLKVSELRFRTVFEQAAVGISHVSPDGHWLRVNKRLCDIVGYTSDELMGKTFQDITHPDDLNADLDLLRQVLADEIKTYTMEKRYYRKNGSMTWIELTVSLVRDEHGAPDYFISVIVDINDRKAAEMNLRAAKDVAEKATKAKSEFLAAMSHDLRTPLNAIMGFCEMMSQEAFGPVGHAKYREYLGDIHSSGELLVSLINDVLDLSKIEAGKYELNEKPVHVGTTINTCMRQLSSLAREYAVSLSARVPDHLPDLICDERALTQILNNLLSNAIKFTPSNGRVDVSAEILLNGGICLSVIDTGVGMSERDIRRATAPFEQATSTISRDQRGTGLGLYLCLNLMQLMGGKLSISSAVEKGTTVTLAFPAERTTKG